MNGECCQMATGKLLELFNSEYCCWTVALIVAAFVLGAIVSCILCKVTCKCKHDGSCARKGARNARRENPKVEKRHTPPADGSVEIYVGNLSYDMTEELLRKEFEAFGTVNSARIITNRYTNRSKGFGCVHMPNREEAEKACAALNDKELLGRKLKCNEAKNNSVS